MVYMLKGGVVPHPTLDPHLPRVPILLRVAHDCVNCRMQIRPPLIATLIISILTVMPILILTMPLYLLQYKIYNARVALLLDGFALLFWLAAFTALASYQDIYRYYGRDGTIVRFEFDGYSECHSAWRSGVAATVSAAVEFVPFLLTTLASIYYYHCDLVGIAAPGLGRCNTNKDYHGAEAAMAGNGTNATGIFRGPNEGEGQQMPSFPQQSTIITTTSRYDSGLGNGLHHSGTTATINTNGTTVMTSAIGTIGTSGQQFNLPYPDQP
ncbi:hypothetical protein K504DRAFT_501765 [Pleomassaria siparia CBS 279.74]|uniref:MARVEL domain-containing protein n=1 Tax=Pleomassaria siparia CBS 279.74 TaxID=1314801 RepID=A0A6G1KDI7_9PLEO|nr:hypothetical protein K504DRAFT_501765 [Pleomassaria siparia CBS 279.74]